MTDEQYPYDSVQAELMEILEVLYREQMELADELIRLADKAADDLIAELEALPTYDLPEY
ncbi:MAG: hypothetical protein WAO49_02695 [Arcanobacterium sp.]